MTNNSALDAAGVGYAFHQIFLADFCLTQNVPHIRSQKVVRNLRDNGAV